MNKSFLILIAFYTSVSSAESDIIEKASIRIEEPSPAIKICDHSYWHTPTKCTVKGSVKEGVSTLIRGNVITDEQVLIGGEVLIGASGKITSVGCSVSHEEVVEVDCLGAVISPGLINLHEHLAYSHYNQLGLNIPKYTNRQQWRAGVLMNKDIQVSKTENQHIRMYTEVRHLLSGTTSLLGSGGIIGLARNLESDKIASDQSQPLILADNFPLKDSDGTMLIDSCDYKGFAQKEKPWEHSSRVYVMHMGEGFDQAAYNEVNCFINEYNRAQTKSPLVVVHGIALDDKILDFYKKNSVSVVWSPRTNMVLYNQTAPINVFESNGINVALGTDWSRSGSLNLLDEMRFGLKTARAQFESEISYYRIFKMATKNAARAIKMENFIGSIKVGNVADLSIFSMKPENDNGDVFKAVVEAKPQDLSLVFLEGKPVVFSEDLKEAFMNDSCITTPLDVCGNVKYVCGFKAEKLDMTKFDPSGIAPLCNANED